MKRVAVRRETCDVKAGQVYRASAVKGHRLVRVLQVRGLTSGSQAPYALLREVLPSGKPASGWTEHGAAVPRGVEFVSRLTWRDDAWRLSAAYERRDDAEEV